MGMRLRRTASAMTLAAMVASGWVYAYLRSRSTEAPGQPSVTPAPQPGDPVQLWHGRVTRVGEAFRQEDRTWLVQYPVWNVFQKREYVEQMWFWVDPGTVTERRTGQPGELAVGQRVSILWRNPVVATAPASCRAERVVIEPDDLPSAQP